MIARLGEHWKAAAFIAVAGVVLVTDPGWVFEAVRYYSAMIYALLLALSS